MVFEKNLIPDHDTDHDLDFNLDLDSDQDLAFIPDLDLVFDPNSNSYLDHSVAHDTGHAPDADLVLDGAVSSPILRYV